MEEEREAAAVARDVPPGAGGAEASRSRATTMKVVVGVDASEESLHALSWALDHVVRLHPGASIVVVHAQHRADHFVYPVAAHGLAYAPPMAVDSMKKTQDEVSRKVVSRALEVCANKQVTATAAVGGGRPEGGHLPGHGGHARRPARPRQPRPRHDQEGVPGKRQRLPRPPRELPRSDREAPVKIARQGSRNLHLSRLSVSVNQQY